MHKSLLVFRFFLAGHFAGHFIGAFRGAFKGHFKTGHLRGILDSWGHFLVWRGYLYRGKKKSPFVGLYFIPLVLFLPNGRLKFCHTFFYPDKYRALICLSGFYCVLKRVLTFRLYHSLGMLLKTSFVVGRWVCGLYRWLCNKFVSYCFYFNHQNIVFFTLFHERKIW